MANDRPQHTLTDFMAEAISPALIMALVGSLVFFLVEVLYVGQYSERLLWGLFFFVFAAVLIARISIQSPAKARVYALLLAVPVWLTLQFYVEYPEGPLAEFRWAINVGLIAVIWWCAHRLTWDCTFIDEDADVSGTGLLQAAGLEKPAPDDAPPAEEEKPEGPDPGWWERYRRYREERRKKHTPGVWVVYFSLAALPLFGLGQSLIPVDEEGRRRYVFWLMVVYVGSGLGLLLTTTFLGLRHYLRQRGVRMPAAMTGAWLTMGGILVVALLVVGALLPRPRAEYPLVELPGLGSPERQASRWAVKGGAPGKGEGRPSSQAPRGNEKNEAQSGNQGKGGDGQGQGREGARGEKTGPNSGDRQGGQGGSQGKAEGRQDGGRSGEQGQGSGERGNSQGKPGEGQDKGGAGQRPQDQQRDGNAGQRQGEPRQGQSGNQASEQARPPSETGQPPPERPGGSVLGRLLALLAALAPILKWIVFVVFALVVAFLVLRGVLRFLANFTNWARDLLKALRSWWEGLFGWLGRREERDGEAAEEIVQAPPPRPFASYRNPFRDGSADRLGPEKLVRYAFEAFQAWTWERDLGRPPDETPLEFAARVGMEVPGLEADAGRLAVLYARVLYARGPLPADARTVVEQFWERLEAVAEQPLSA